MQSDVNFPLVLCKPTSQIIQPKFNQCKRFVLHPHFSFIYLTISILGSSIIFGLSLKYTLRFVPSKMQTVWDVYMKTRDCSLFEARQLSFMVFRDKILAQHSKEIKELEVSKKFLEQEVAAYKGMLDDIKSLLENHETTKR